MKRFVHAFFGGCLSIVLAAGATLAAAADYPDKPVRLVVGMAPGGSNDTLARLVATELSKTWPQPVIVENKPGANSTIATADVARSKPDGYTLMLVISSHVTNTLLYPKLNYSLKDFEPVSLIANAPFLLVANPAFPPDTTQAFLDAAKAGKNSIDFGTPGPGSTQHIALAMLEQMGGVKLNHIPYKGGAPAQTDVLAGVIPLIFATPTQSLPFVQQKKLKALAVTSRTRQPYLPDVPTLDESGVPGYEANVWFGIVAPAGTPKEVVDYLHQEISRVVQNPDMKQRLSDMGMNVVDASPQAFQRLMSEEETKWRAVIQESHIQLN